MTKKVLSIMLTILMVLSVVPMGMTASAKYTGKEKTSGRATAPADTTDYLTFKSADSFTITVQSLTCEGTISYSTDKNTWTTVEPDVEISSSDDTEHVLYFRGYGNTKEGYDAWIFEGGKSGIYASGNIMTLLDYTNPDGVTMGKAAFMSMFADCTQLKTAPKLPATTLSHGCYDDMFANCTSLTEVPELPATDLPELCYYGMFAGCTSLKKLPDLSKVTSANGGSMDAMFADCSGIELYNTDQGSGETWTSPNVSNDNMEFMLDGTGGYCDSTPEPNTVYYYPLFPHSVTVKTATGGKVTVTTIAPYYVGDIIKLSAQPDTGYKLSSYSVYKTDDPTTTITVTNGRFTMPNYDVTVEPTFEDTTDYVKFTSDDEFSITISNTPYEGTLEYSTDKSTWTEVKSYTKMSNTTDSDHVLYFRGKGNTKITDSSSWNISQTGSAGVYASGNIMTLLDYTDPDNATMGEAAFAYMFAYQSALKSAPKLPATTITKACYHGMFQSTNITEAPELPAMEMQEACYCVMFYGCKELVKAPELPATKLAQDCYANMFENSGITTPPSVLPAKETATTCYSCMFIRCKNLTTAPKILVETVGGSDMGYMFADTALTRVPDLSSIKTSTGSSALSCMFSGCSGIKLYKTGSGDSWTCPNLSQSNFQSMLSGTGGDNIGTPIVGVTYYYDNTITKTPLENSKYYASLTLNDKIDVNFTIKNIDTENFDLDKLTINGQKVDASAYDSSTGTIDLKLATEKLAELSNSLDIIVNYDNVGVKGVSYTVGNYCKSAIASKGETSELGNICKSILNLGAKAYEYFKVSTSTFNDGYAYDFDSIDLTGLGDVVKTDTLTSAQMKLDEGVAMKLSYTTSDECAVEDFKIVNNLGEIVTDDNITLTKTDDGYDLMISNLGASKLSRTYTVTNKADSQFNATVSVYSLSKLGAANASDDDGYSRYYKMAARLTNLYKALYMYGEAAKDYKGI